MKLVTWNVNGLRTLFDFDSTVKALGSDILCVQETRLGPSDPDLGRFALLDGHNAYFSFCRPRTGYSGVATFVRDGALTPRDAGEGLLNPVGGAAPQPDASDSDYRPAATRAVFDMVLREGRAVVTDHGRFVLLNMYVPASGGDMERASFRAAMLRAAALKATALRDAGRHVVLVGDFNVVPTLADTSERIAAEDRLSWHNSPSRAALRALCKATDVVDGFRRLCPRVRNAFTCWSTATRSRELNAGVRIDYVLLARALADTELRDAAVHAEVTGSDHAPTSVTLEHPDYEAVDGPAPPPFCVKNLPGLAVKQASVVDLFRGARRSQNQHVKTPAPTPSPAQVSVGGPGTNSLSWNVHLSPARPDPALPCPKSKKPPATSPNPPLSSTNPPSTLSCPPYLSTKQPSTSTYPRPLSTVPPSTSLSAPLPATKPPTSSRSPTPASTKPPADSPSPPPSSTKPPSSSSTYPPPSPTEPLCPPPSPATKPPAISRSPTPVSTKPRAASPYPPPLSTKPPFSLTYPQPPSTEPPSTLQSPSPPSTKPPTTSRSPIPASTKPPVASSSPPPSLTKPATAPPSPRPASTSLRIPPPRRELILPTAARLPIDYPPGGSAPRTVRKRPRAESGAARSAKQSRIDAFFCAPKRESAAKCDLPMPSKVEDEATPPASQFSQPTQSKLNSNWARVFGKAAKAPRCRHGEPCVLKTVNKTGPNRGRTFWSCARPGGKKGDSKGDCGFFEWAPYSANKPLPPLR